MAGRRSQWQSQKTTLSDQSYASHPSAQQGKCAPRDPAVGFVHCSDTAHSKTKMNMQGTFSGKEWLPSKDTTSHFKASRPTKTRTNRSHCSPRRNAPTPLLRLCPALWPPLTRRHHPRSQSGAPVSRGRGWGLGAPRSPRRRQCSTWQCCPMSNSAISPRPQGAGHSLTGRAMSARGA